MQITTHTPEETKEVVRQFVSTLRPQAQAVVLALEGDLGAGKTTFSQFLGEAFGVKDPIQSPTYLIEKIYELRNAPWQHLVHIDAYRLESEQELVSLGWQDIVARPENLVLVEWANKIKGILPPSAIRIVLTHAGQTSREIEISTP